jgi:3-dehydroquinate dehydratase/shikimate dehydrogenase
MKRYPQTKFILSYHNFQETPTDLEALYHVMKNSTAYGYKIAAMVHSTNDALKMLLFAKSHNNLSVICMGEKGKFARVLGPVVGNQIDYASLIAKEQTASGQLTVSELMEFYHYSSLNEKTAIYGLIGDPIDKSLGYVYHNRVFRERDVNAVYVKMCVKPEELAEFIPLAARLGIKGLSVTMPLKEKIFSFLDEIQPAMKQIGAVNTLLFKDGKIKGANYDGEGALDALEKKSVVRGKKVVLLGAGGAARAIAFEAKRRGAAVVILNRTVQRAKELAAELSCDAGAIDELPDAYDILINCTPNLMPIDPQLIKAKIVVMDVINSPSETAFLTAASLKECELVYGKEMFLNQAAKQTAFWMG